MSRRFLCACVLALITLACTDTLRAADAKRPPNIVFILADDLGWTDLACQGSKFYETPHIDRLAKQGTRLSCFYNCQNCTPTRAALMSGQYPPRTGVYTVGTLERGLAEKRKMDVPANETQLPLDRKTVANQLKESGYVTGMFGKWHIGQAGKYHPAQRGFDEAIVSMGKHFGFATNPPVSVPAGAYLADWLTDKAVDFISRHKDRPFFLYLPHFGVHSPHHAKQDLIERFKKKMPVGGHHDPTYAAMIASLDESVGRVLAALDELKLSENTIVIFSSDNGGVGGYGWGGITSNAPLRAGKGTLYCGGLRVPFIIRWPGHTKPGSTCPVPALHVDLFPTFLEVAGAKKPSQVLDGESLVPLFNDPEAKLKRDAVFFHFPGYLEGSKEWRTTPVGAIQAGDWKLMEFFETGTLELYNLGDDLGERNNLATQMPAKAKELHQRLVAWRQEIKAAMPRFKAPPQGTGADRIPQSETRLAHAGAPRALNGPGKIGSISMQDAALRKTTYVYKTVGPIKIEADVYRSPSEAPRPVLVWIHGGALIMGGRESVPKQLMELARTEDYRLVSIDYRLAPEVKLPAIADDVADALGWVRKEGPKLFAADPNRIVVSGGSAGGYLTLLSGVRVQPRPRALVAYWGYGDVDGDWYTKPSEFYRTKVPLVDEDDARTAIGKESLTYTSPSNQKARGRLYHYFRQNGLWTKEVTGFDPALDRAKLDAYCPVRSIPADYPPALLIHGTKDDDVPYEQSAAMAAALAIRKLPHELVTVAGAGHGLFGGDPKVVQAAHARALAFIREHLSADR